MGSITDATILHHVCIVLLLLWCLNSFNCCHPVAYFLSLVYIYLVHEGYVLKLRKKLQFEEKKESNQRRVLSDSETVRWLNQVIERMWPVCMEEIVSQKILSPIVPWFLKKYKPWTAKDIELQHLYLGRSPPIFTDMRILQPSNGDDHLVLELGINFRTADDMSGILGVKLRKRLGFGMWAKLHLLGLHIEGKVLVGVKFLHGWPFISRLRLCFAGPPYCQMTVKPIFTHGLDVTEVPGIAGWIDNLLAVIFEETLVEPNMLVVDVEKFASPQPENWFSVDAKEPVAHAIVEVLEAADMKPSDLNGLADPYVKGQLGPYRFRTKIHKKTLTPKWREEFKIPICTWDSQNVLVIEVLDKDPLFDDMLGECTVNINELRDGQRHDLWLPLQNIKTGRLHLAVTVLEGKGKGSESSCDTESADGEKGSVSSVTSGKSPKVADKFEPVDIDGQSETGIWIHHPGSEVLQVWEPRKGRSRQLDGHRLNGQAQGEGGDSVGSLKSSGLNDVSDSDESSDSNKSQSKSRVRRGLRKIGSVFRKSPRGEDKSVSLGGTEPSTPDNVRASNAKGVGVKLIIDDTVVPASPKTPKDEKELPEGIVDENSHHGHAKDVAKSLFKHAGKSASGIKAALSRSKKSKSERGSLLVDNKDILLEPDSSGDESFPSSTPTAVAEHGVVIPGSAISGPESVSRNDSSGSKDSVETATPSHNNSFKSTDNAVHTGAKSDNISVKTVVETI
ncbi:C2 domain-containing protein [Sesamum alatum]|uniref:C2 domain-containing protein n=1 Tax=Sesamum alatum TaxID=300844 RepID=A0AAE1YZ63_9LAMI|nr:C2 domain-containing protein [Sesamum alatum]